MHEPTTRPELTRRASHREAAPTAAQWACCSAAGSMVGHPLAWQVAVYHFAHAQAAQAVHAAELRAEWARWN